MSFDQKCFHGPYCTYRETYELFIHNNCCDTPKYIVCPFFSTGYVKQWYKDCVRNSLNTIFVWKNIFIFWLLLKVLTMKFGFWKLTSGSLFYMAQGSLRSFRYDRFNYILTILIIRLMRLSLETYQFEYKATMWNSPRWF